MNNPKVDGASLLNFPNFDILYCAAAAAHWREKHPAMGESGFVVLYRDEVTGWGEQLWPASWSKPGCIAMGALGADGPIYVATGGNDFSGAVKWVAMWDRANVEHEDSRVRATWSPSKSEELK